MPPAECLIPFLVATSVFAVTPGPGMLYMAVQTMVHGGKAGLHSSFAFHVASYVHIVLGALGVTALLHAAPVMLIILKLAGALYLVWMGVRMVLKKPEISASAHSDSKRPASPAFRDSLTVEILNPKSALFYFAFLPQFTSPNASSEIYVQILVLGMIANVMFSMTDLVCILAAYFVVAKAASVNRKADLGRRIGGCVLIGMGTKMVFESGQSV